MFRPVGQPGERRRRPISDIEVAARGIGIATLCDCGEVERDVQITAFTADLMGCNAGECHLDLVLQQTWWCSTVSRTRRNRVADAPAPRVRSQQDPIERRPRTPG